MKHLITLMLFIATLPAFSQRTCGSMQNLQEQILKDPTMLLKRAALERHTQDYQFEQRNDNVITIPVVFHVIHDGDAVGIDENISEELILSQLDQLNDDFAKLNSDAGTVPPVFQAFAADTKIQFCLATRAPNCQATTGINRYNYGQSSYTRAYVNGTIKPATIWDRDQYINIWTVIFGAPDDGLLGFATFPGGSPEKDGVVVASYTVGSINNPNPNGGPYNLGRTLTHEVGHFFNLFHIWGDDDDEADHCSFSDEVADTPNQELSNGGCPTFPHISCSNGPDGDMFMNYMDYVNDNCMHMFSLGQKTRMRAVLIGGDREPLASSLGCSAPTTELCYCSASADETDFEKISNIAFADINNPSNSIDGYEDFTTIIGNVSRSIAYDFTASLSNGDALDQVIVWIDYNMDGDFEDSGEEVFTSIVGGPYTSSITIPSDAPLGSTRLRVRMHYSEDGYGPNATSCGNSAYGQVEDYTLNIQVNLPMDLLSFNAQLLNNKDALLTWESERQSNIKGFDIEVATDDLNDFDLIGHLPYNEENQYMFMYKDLSSKTNYFRLKLVDLNGNEEYSKIKAVNLISDFSEFKLFPNPANDMIHLRFDQPTNANCIIDLVNHLGENLKTIEIQKNLLETQIDLSGLPAGAYYINVKSGSNSNNKVFFVERF